MIITFIAYDESMSKPINELMEQLSAKYTDIRYWYIKHDRDIYDSGELKKTHYHIALDINFMNKSHTIYEKQKIATMFGRNVESIEKVNNPTGLLRYLTHKDNNDKEPYLISEVVTNDYDTLSNALELEPKVKRSADDDLEELFNWIEQQDYVTQRMIFDYQRQHRLFFKMSAVSKVIQQFVAYHNEWLKPTTLTKEQFDKWFDGYLERSK